MTTTDDVPDAFAVAIDGRPFAVDFSELQFGSLETMREQIDVGEQPGERSLNPADLWRRSQNSWEMGAGQEWLDREISVPQMFWRSKGVDPWDRGRMRLLSAADLISGSPTTNVGEMVVADGVLYVVRTDYLSYWDGSTWADTAAASTGNNFGGRRIATDGTRIYVGPAADGVHRYTPSTDTWDKLALTNTFEVGFVKGHLLAGHIASPALYHFTDIDAGNTQRLDDGLAPDLNWRAFGETPAAIYAAADIGSASHIYRLQIREDATGMRPPVHAAQLPDGEHVNAIIGYLGVVVLATTNGVRLAVEDGGGLSVGAYIDVGAVRGLTADGRFVWFTLSDPDHDGGAGIGRVDLQRFVPGDELVPAHATDLYSGSAGDSLSVATFGGKRVFSVRDTGVFIEQDSKVAEGWFDTGKAIFSLADKKIFHAVEWRAADAGGGITVDLDVDGTNQVSETSTVKDAGPFTTGDGKGEWANARFTLSNGTTEPELERWILRGLPVPRRSFAYPLPLDLATTVNTMRPDVRDRDVEQEYDDLVTLMRDGRPVTFQLLDRTLTAFIDDVRRGPNVRPSDDHHHLEGPCVVSLRVFDA